MSGWTVRKFALLAGATTGAPAKPPMEALLARVWRDHVRFDLATVSPATCPPGVRPQMGRVLGPKALRPLALEQPAILSPMGGGLGVTGPVLPAESMVAPPWIWQWPRIDWRRQVGNARFADLIELQVGQATKGGIAIHQLRSRWPRQVRRRAGPGFGPVTIRGGLRRPPSRWVRHARLLGRGCPIAVKIPATNHVQGDLAHLVALGVDMVSLDGAGAGTAGSPAVLSDHQGIPTLVAVVRAHRWLVHQGVRDRVSPNASGHVHSGADVAKLLALGADAVSRDSAALLALSHGRWHPWVPLRGPARLMLTSSAQKRPVLDVDGSAVRLAHWLEATVAELGVVAASLGVRDLAQLGPQHLVADIEEAARLVGIRGYGDEDRARAGYLSGAPVAELVADTVSTWREANRVWQRVLDLLARSS